MRPLWRNTLWLAFAAACGGAGLWFGFDHGANLGVDATTGLHTSHQARQELATIDLALDLLEQPISEKRRRSVDFELRESLGYLGAYSGTLRGWWSCPRSGPATLARARVYLQAHPEPKGAWQHHHVDEGLLLCEEVAKPRPDA